MILILDREDLLNMLLSAYLCRLTVEETRKVDLFNKWTTVRHTIGL